MTTKTSHRPHTDPHFLKHVKRQAVSKASLQDIQQSLSKIGVSLSKRVIEDREKR